MVLIRYQWVLQDYISKMQTSMVLLILNGTAKIKLAILTFMYCKDFVKNSIFKVDIISLCFILACDPFRDTNIIFTAFTIFMDFSNWMLGYIGGLLVSKDS